jgi:hypothetical protein
VTASGLQVGLINKKLLLGKTERVARKGDILGVNSDGTAIKAEGGEIISDIGNTGKGEYTPGNIENIKTELLLMDNSSEPENPGINQMISSIWPKIRELDMCIPGPDVGWESRLTDELNRNSKKLQEKTSDSDGEKAAQADLVLKELKFAVALLKSWIKDKMITALPSSITYLESINELEPLYQESKELVDKKRDKTLALARLTSIEVALNSITEQPKPGTPEEVALVSQWKKYQAVRSSISSTATIEDTKKQLSVKKDQLENLKKSLTQCQKERSDKGWSNPGGGTSTLVPKNSTTSTTSQTEQNMFCDAPIKGGYDHETFIHTNDTNKGGVQYGVTHPEIPYVNAKKVYAWRGTLGSIFTLGIGGRHQVDIDLKCNIIYKSNITDYKKELPGLTPAGVIDTPSLATPVGTCTYTGAGFTENECEGNGGTWDSIAGTCTPRTDTETSITEENCKDLLVERRERSS